MFALQPAHEAGMTLTDMGPQLVLTGGADGVVTLFTRKCLSAAPKRSQRRRPPGSQGDSATSQSCSVTNSSGGGGVLWARQCHDGAVTAVWLAEALQLGFSCGRDGKVILHEHLPLLQSSAAEGSASGRVEATSRVICRVTGELRCMWFDSPRRRLFIGGDSLRCLQMNPKAFTVVSIPLVVPHPLVAIACNETGDLLAMASAASSGAVGVTSVNPTFLAHRQQQQQQLQQGESQMPEETPSQTQTPHVATEVAATLAVQPHFLDAHRAATFRFPDVLSASLTRSEAQSLRLCWASLPSTPDHTAAAAGGRTTTTTTTTLLAAPQLLFVPTMADVHLFRFDPATVAPFVAHRMHLVGSLHGATALESPQQPTAAYFSIACYPLSLRRLLCVAATTAGVSVVKLDTGRLSTTVMAAQSFVDVANVVGFPAEEAALLGEGSASHRPIDLTSMTVCRRTGDVVVGLSDGRVSYMTRLAPKEGSAPPATASQPAETRTNTALDGVPRAKKSKLRKLVSSEGEPHTAHEEEFASSHPSKERSLLSSSRRPNAAPTARTNKFLLDDEEEEEALLLGGNTNATAASHRTQTSAQHAPLLRRVAATEPDSFINDEDEEESDSLSSSGRSSSSSSRSRSSSDSSATAEEDLEDVVKDLQISGRQGGAFEDSAELLSKDDVSHVPRPSRWRHRDVRKAMNEGTRELRAHPTATSIYLDDEASEVSSEEMQEEMEEARGDRDSSDDDDDENEDEEEGDEEPYQPDRVVNRYRRTEIRNTASGGSMPLYSFQVGATPAAAVSGEEEASANGSSCYLAYNGVGFIHQVSQSTVIHFHNIAVPAIRLKESRPVRMGSLSPTGAGFVIAPSNGDQEADDALNDTDNIDDALAEDALREHPTLFNRSKPSDVSLWLHYRSFTAVGAQSSWWVRLPRGEGVRAIAAGLHYLAVATTMSYLRIFSTSGLELAVLSKYNHIVTLLGMNSQRLFESTSSSSSQSLGFDPLVVVYLSPSGDHLFEILDVSTRSSVSTPQALPLTPIQPEEWSASAGGSHQLKWIGWSDDGPLHTVDTAGVVRLYTKSWGGSWVPVFDPRHAPTSFATSHLWVWGASEDQLLAHRCPEELAYPMAISGGLSVEHVPVLLPLTKPPLTDQQSAVWEQLLRRQIRTDEMKQRSEFYTDGIARRDALHDKRLLSLFESALKDQQTTRAIDLAERLELRDNIELCARQANAGGYSQLVRRLLNVLEARVKSKLKRRCTLPLEGTLIGEREKDRVLRRLLAKERDEQSHSRVVVPPQSASTPTPPPPPLSHREEGADAAVPQRAPEPETVASESNSAALKPTTAAGRDGDEPVTAAGLSALPVPRETKRVTFSVEEIRPEEAVSQRPLESTTSATAVRRRKAMMMTARVPPTAALEDRSHTNRTSGPPSTDAALSPRKEAASAPAPVPRSTSREMSLASSAVATSSSSSLSGAAKKPTNPFAKRTTTTLSSPPAPHPPPTASTATLCSGVQRTTLMWGGGARSGASEPSTGGVDPPGPPARQVTPPNPRVEEGRGSLLGAELDDSAVKPHAADRSITEMPQKPLGSPHDPFLSEDVKSSEDHHSGDVGPLQDLLGTPLQPQSGPSAGSSSTSDGGAFLHALRKRLREEEEAEEVPSLSIPRL